MRKRIFKKAVILICLTMLPAAVMARSHHFSANEITHTDISIAEGQTLNEDIVTDKSVTINGVLNGDCVSFGGPVDIKGKVTGDFISLGGTIHLSGLVLGDMISIGAPIETTGNINGNLVLIGANAALKSGTTVQGDISVIGGYVEKDENAIIKGEIVSLDLRFIKRLVPYFLRISNHRREHARPLAFGGLIGFGLLVLISIMLSGAVIFILPAIFFPKNVERVGEAIKNDIWKSLGIGGIIFILLIPILLLLTISVLGIPLIPLIILLFFAAFVLGFSGFTVVLAKRFFEGIKRSVPNTIIAQVAIGYLLFAAVALIGKIIPLIGGILVLAVFMIAVVGVVLGLGAVFTTRMGTIGGLHPVRVSSAKKEIPPVA